MNKQFTEGPWTMVTGIHKETTEFYDKGAKWFMVHNEEGPVAEAVHGRCLDTDEDQAEANARLIANAPAMFELLEEVRLAVFDGDQSGIVERIEQLLTRITTP